MDIRDIRAAVKIVNLDSKSTEDGLKQLIMLLVHLKGTIENIVVINAVNDDHSHKYAYTFFQHECDAKETASALSGLYYKSSILSATVLNASEFNEASLLLSEIQNLKIVEQENLNACMKSSSSSSSASIGDSHQQGHSSDESQIRGSICSSEDISNEKHFSGENESQNVTGKVSSDNCSDEDNESQSVSNSETDSESEDDDDSESSSESKTEQKSAQESKRQYNAVHNTGYRGRGRRRGRGRGQSRNPAINTHINHNVSNSTHQACRGSNWGYQKHYNTASHLFKGSDLRQSNIQNQNYQTPPAWNIPPNFTGASNCSPFNINNQSNFPGNTPGFPNYNIPPPNFAPPFNQYNQHQNFNKTTMGSRPNTEFNSPNNNNGASKNVNVSVSWTQRREGNNQNAPNQVAGSLNKIATDITNNSQSLSKSGNNQVSYGPNLQQSSNNQYNNASTKQQPIINANNQRKNQYDIASSNVGSGYDNQINTTPLQQKALTHTGAKTAPPSVVTSSHSTVTRVPPPVPSRIKKEPTTVGTTSTAIHRTPENIDRAINSLNVGANRLSVRPSSADKKKTDNACVIS